MANLRNSAALNMMTSLFEKLFTLVVYVYASRTLGIEPFGQIVFCFLVIELFNYVAGFGVAEYLIKSPYKHNRLLYQSLIVGSGGGVIACLLMYFLFSRLADSYVSEGLYTLLCFFSFYPVLSILSNIMSATFRKLFNYEYITKVTVACSFVSNLLSCYLLSLDYGAVSLLIGKYLFISGCLLFFVLGQKHKVHICFYPSIFIDMIRFGATFALTQIINFTNSKLIELITSFYLGASALAIIDIGKKFISTLFLVTLTPINNVSLGYFSKKRDDAFAYAQIINLSSLIVLPLVVFIGIFASELNNLVFGDNWIESTLVTQIFSFIAIPSILSWFFSSYLISQNLHNKLIKFCLIDIVVVLGFICIALPYGLYAFVVASVAAKFISAFIKLHYLKQLPHISLSKLMVDGIKNIKLMIVLITTLYACKYLSELVLFPSEFTFYKNVFELFMCGMGLIIYLSLFVLKDLKKLKLDI